MSERVKIKSFSCYNLVNIIKTIYQARIAYRFVLTTCVNIVYVYYHLDYAATILAQRYIKPHFGQIYLRTFITLHRK